MTDIFEQHDDYIGKLNTSNPDKIKPFIKKKVAEAVKGYEAVGKGFGTALVGTPGDVEMLTRGAAEASTQGQQNLLQALGVISKSLGIESVGNVMETLYGSEQNRSALQALLDGMQKDTVLPTTEDIQTYLKDNYNVQFDNEGATLVGELLAPGGYIKAGKKGINLLKEGLGSAKKSFSMPDTLYHGTNAKFDKFDKSKSPNGLYFTDSPQQARKFGENVMDVEVSMKNPFIVDSYRFSSGILEDLNIFKGKIKSKLGLGYDNTIKSNASTIQPRTEEMLKKQGYDGIFIPKEAGILNENVYVPFDASQIKIKGK